MRYLGGKKKISKALASAVAAHWPAGTPLWEPFCGGFGMTPALAAHGRVYASDVCAPLIAMWQAARDGWRPPSELTRDEWEAARALPDTDPLKAFAGFACSYRGLWFSGYAGGYVGPSSRAGALAAAEVVARDAAAPFGLACIDFLVEEPSPGFGAIYCDPPYRGTTGYKGAGRFDHAAFERRVLAWSEICPVLVSEYDFPIGRCVWSHSRAVMMTAGSGARAVEKLFLIECGS